MFELNSRVIYAYPSMLLLDNANNMYQPLYLNMLPSVTQKAKQEDRASPINRNSDQPPSKRSQEHAHKSWQFK